MTTRMIARNTGRNRVATDPSIPRRFTPAVITTIATVTGDTIRLTFNGTVLPNKTPGFLAGANGTDTVIAMTRVSATEIELTFSADVDESQMLVAEGDPGIRTPAGGFVPAGSYAIPQIV